MADRLVRFEDLFATRPAAPGPQGNDSGQPVFSFKLSPEEIERAWSLEKARRTKRDGLIVLAIVLASFGYRYWKSLPAHPAPAAVATDSAGGIDPWWIRDAEKNTSHPSGPTDPAGR